ncbi:transposase, partial [Arsenophonus sp. ENCA]|uniref:transposase n=1 Tax=Arsenophonus sp. ENCA TaxID=1987579 RepID=UPI0025C2C28A
ILNQRKSMVEPVFSALRGIQGLERFRRKGLLAVKLEFTLHAMAYNLSRAVALILWMIFSLLFVQTKIRKRENLHGGILLKKKFHPFCDSLAFSANWKRAVLMPGQQIYRLRAGSWPFCPAPGAYRQ